MFDKVIVGVDGRSGGRDAIALARELVAPDGQTTLAHVYIESLLPARGSPGVFTAGEHERSRELLEAARRDAGIDAQIMPVPAHHVGRGLHELAEDIEADLIVVGSSRHSLAGRVLQGDDLRAALNGAPCAVAIAPGGFTQRATVLGEIGVGFDGSPESERALELARAFAAHHGARVSVFEAVSPAHGFTDSRHPGPNEIADDVQAARVRLAALGGVEVHAAYGEAAEELALYAHSARCPLLVLPRSARVSQGTGTAERETAGAPS
jgi:nucleotide-binding universal stress UspA family protein